MLKLLRLLRENRAFLNSIKRVVVYEGHEIFFSGIDRHDVPAFRPCYGKLRKFLPKLSTQTTIHVLSTTLPPHVIQTVQEELCHNRERLYLRLPLNRRNTTYATRTIKDLGQYKNLIFLIPNHDPSSRPTGIIVFFGSSVRADGAASYLNNACSSGKAPAARRFCAKV